MKLDLSDVEVFENDEIEFDRKITFIYGKNGTGKTTLTNEIQNKILDYEVSAFEGFSNIIDENKRLNAVVLGEENTDINKKIMAKREIIRTKQLSIDNINKSLKEPQDAEVSNFWTRRNEAEKDVATLEKKIEDFYTKAASEIKKIDRIKVPASYNKRGFYNDIESAEELSEEKINEYIATINSEIKIAPAEAFPLADLGKLKSDVDNILKKTVIEHVKIARIDNNPDKREFAKNGLKIHKKGDMCAFCGNSIPDSVFSELTNYFSADEVKVFQQEILDKQEELNGITQAYKQLHLDANSFYPMYQNEMQALIKELEENRKEALAFLKQLMSELEEKKKYLFEGIENNHIKTPSGITEISEKYEELRIINNANDLSARQTEASDKLRCHFVKVQLNGFNYDSTLAELGVLKNVKKKYEDEYNQEQLKITGPGGLEEEINNVEAEIVALQSSTKNETLLAQEINKKLKHMVSFELVHVEDEDSKGFYRVKNTSTGEERDITELSTGEKNIIAFLYFIGKLNEIKETPSNKNKIIVFDDPMNSNDDGMQYLIIEELQNLMNNISEGDYFILLTHNKHFYLNVKYGHYYNKDRFLRFQSDGKHTNIMCLRDKKDDYKTSYEALWDELKYLYNLDAVSADILLNPIRRIIETYVKFNGFEKNSFCKPVYGAMKLFNVNSHSIDDLEAELNGKTKKEIVQMFYDCFAKNNLEEHFKKLWSDIQIDNNGKIV